MEILRSLGRRMKVENGRRNTGRVIVTIGRRLPVQGGVVGRPQRLFRRTKPGVSASAVRTRALRPYQSEGFSMFDFQGKNF